VEANPAYSLVVAEVFRQISAGRFEGTTSVVSCGEVLVLPARNRDIGLRHRYLSLLFETAGIHTRSINRAAAELAAELRAKYGFRLPDALQLAVAIQNQCEAFLTNDRRLARVTEIRVLVLDDLEL
jgi:predicted nucleic acid-binding protein